MSELTVLFLHVVLPAPPLSIKPLAWLVASGGGKLAFGQTSATPPLQLSASENKANFLSINLAFRQRAADPHTPFGNTWTVACRAPLTMAFSRQEYWSRFPFPTPGDLPDSGIELVPLESPALEGVFFTTEPPRKPEKYHGFTEKLPWWLRR